MQRFESFDGAALAFERHGEGPAAILLHGFMASSAWTWGPTGVVAALVEAGHTAVPLDARGHGRSARPHDPAAYADGAMARDVGALLDHLPLDEAVLVGTSMGGFTALEAASRDPRIRRVAVTGVGPLTKPRAGFREHARVMLADAPAPEDPFRSFVDAHPECDRRALGAWLAGAHLPQITARSDLSAVTCPVLVANGVDDPLDAEALAAALPDARAMRVPGDHVTSLATNELAAAIVRFLDRAAGDPVPPRRLSAAGSA